MALDLKESGLEHNLIKERVNVTGKYFDEISSKLHYYIDTLSNVRDSGEDVAKSISSFASKENYNKTLRLRLGEFSDILLAIQEYREAQKYRTTVKVMNELENFKPFCKQTQADLKKCFESRVRKLKKKNDLEKARSKSPSNWQKIAQAEKESNEAQDQALRMTQEMTRIVENFERKKLKDLKHTFLEFIKIEMVFHAKAIELYTKAFNVLKDIKVDEDLHDFISYFKSTSALDPEAQSPVSHVTVPKAIDANIEECDSVTNSSHMPQVLKGEQGPSCSVLTLKTAADINSGSSSESFIES